MRSLAGSLAGAVTRLAAPARPQNDGYGPLENPNIPITSDQLAVMLGGGPTASGVPVGERSAMRSTAVFASVSLVSGLLGSLPLEVYSETDDGRELAPKHRLAPLLSEAPNADIGLTSFIWRELMGVHLNTNGNHYSAIEYDGAARPIGVVPLDPWRTTPYRKTKEGLGWRRGYRYQSLDGSLYDLDQDDVLHVPGLGFDGLKGLSPISNCGRQAIGASLAMEEASARFLANGARPSGVVSQGPGKPLSPEALRELKGEFRHLYGGMHNTGETVFLDNGMTWAQVQMSLKDAELLESRKFGVADIARIFGVPPFLIGETADMTAWGSGLEQIMLAFLLLNLERWLKRIEGEIKLKLFTPGNFYPLFDRDALNATNTAGRADFFSKMAGAGLTYNEIRRKLHQKRVVGGDEPMVPVNYQPLSRAMSTNPAPPEAMAA